MLMTRRTYGFHHLSSRLRQAMLLVGLFLFPHPILANDVVIDGHFDDWKKPLQRVQDETGDATAAFDLSFLEVNVSNTQVFLHFDIGQTLNLQSGKRSEGTLQLKLTLRGEKTLTVDFRERQAYLDDQTDERIAWTSLRMVSQPTYASDEVEMRLDLRAIGAKNGDTLSIQFAGSDSLDEPIDLVLRGEPVRFGQAIDRAAPDDFRVASFNTMNQGVADENRQGKFLRLFTAVDPDVICFQEEKDERRFAESVSKVLPERSEERWSTHWANGAAIATYHKLRPLPLEITAGATAAITVRDAKTWVVLSIHLKCCGYAGSPEDKLRVTQVAEIKEQLERIRSGEFGEQLVDAPVIIVGDFNLVGSRDPLQELQDVGFDDAPSLGLHDLSWATWRGRPEESFWPGRLDLMTFSRERAKVRRCFTVDSSLFPPSELQRTGIKRDDSSVSDHLMVVASFFDPSDPE